MNELVPLLQEQLPGKTLSTELQNTDESLLKGLETHLYQLVILHEYPDNKKLFCQRYLEEQLYITLPQSHILAGKESVSFSDLSGLRILMTSGVGFWMNITLEKLPAPNLLIQNNMDALNELIDTSSLPYFNSDQMLRLGYESAGRVSVPISDREAHATYWIACLSSEKQKFQSLFNAVRAALLRQ